MRSRHRTKYSLCSCIAFSEDLWSPNMEVPHKQPVVDSKQLKTFVQVDIKTFKDVVQRLTGSSDVSGDSGCGILPGKGNIGVKRQEFKLHERRPCKAKLEIIKPPLSFKQRFQEQLVRSPEQQRYCPSTSGERVLQSSLVGTPTKCFSGPSLVEREAEGELTIHDVNAREEEKAIKERRFYLHPSPRSNPEFIEPELLSLFPLTSPKQAKCPEIFLKDSS